MGVINGKIAIVTGASGGIGRETAKMLGEEGAKVVVAARREEVLAELVQDGRASLAVPTDVTDERSVTALVERTVEVFGRLDLLVNCAGTGSFATVLDSDPQEWERILAVNLTGTYLCCRAVLRPMLRQQSGHIVNVLSIAATVPFPGASAYCASKFGALGLTKVLAAEVRASGVRVTALLPGAVDTPFWNGIDHPPDRTKMVPPRRVAEAVLFAVSQPEGATVDEIVLMPPLGVL
ncbi:MAG: SDR family oxidoreductase [Candidatus Latescibacteria bacterium]|nr:SDR family oxidoreductase [Candidatus Latescibacterota bacterium]